MRKILLVLFLLSLSSPALATDWCDSATGCWLYKEGSGTTVADDSPNANTGDFKADGEPAWVGSVTGTGAPAYASDCVDQDGTDDYVVYGTGLDNVSPFSYVAWVQPDTTNNFERQYISSANVGGGGSAGMLIGFIAYADLAFQVFNTGSANFIYATSIDSITPNGNWYHTAITWDGTTGTSAGDVIIYINGVDATTAISSNGGTRRDDAGFYKGTGSGYDGALTENAIFSSELSSTDINDIMDNGLVQATARRRNMLIQ